MKSIVKVILEHKKRGKFMKIKKVVLIIIDGFGVGALPDANSYGDENSNTLFNIFKHVPNLTLSNLESLGLGKIIKVPGLNNRFKALGSYGKMQEKSPGKDTITGHWEISGIILNSPFPTYPNGFPAEIITTFERRIGKKVLGNKAASGTEIIKELGEKHISTGYPIVYTSADSVFQIAAHEDVISIQELYNYCLIAREILQGTHGVGRVIARPFIGKPGNFKRTANRRDYSLPPPEVTMLDLIKEKGFDVTGIGKINDIFAGQGLTKSIPTNNNADGINKTINTIKDQENGLIFTNLIDFDQLYGHRNDVEGYATELQYFDDNLSLIIDSLDEKDILVISSDHGCDPTTPSTDHSREYVPVIFYGHPLKKDIDLGTRSTFADLGTTITELLGCKGSLYGKSMVDLLMRR